MAGEDGWIYEMDIVIYNYKKELFYKMAVEAGRTVPYPSGNG